ncbi:unnamed protein product [Thelazia callipaeda]|uniref:PH domain-containing protein n=1 Tax=Thelazia callipaeda TaxID=103827 RepID=A0A0N5CY56_THECL|nr:unnamed protein product [Thelazia callipaeda]
MNNEQLQDWLTALNERWRSSVEKQALKDVGHEQMLLKLEACNTHYLINYLKCNYADVDLIQPVLGQLLACYCRGGVLRYFTMQCIPSLIHLYLLALAKRQKKSISMFEILFLAIYNEEILVAGTSSGSGMKKVDKIRIPSTRFPSVYHDPRKLNILSDVSFKSGSTSFVEMTVRIGPYKSADKITPENRQTILTRLLKSVNSCLCRLSHDVICKYICSTTISVCQSGFHFSETSLKSRVCDEDLCSEELDEFSMKPRLQSSAQYLLESLNGLYFALFNGESQLAIQAIDAVHQRALYEFYSDVILVTNSIKDTLLESSFQSNERLLKCNRSNHGKVDGRRGSELITNSSLRLKKMPEDISPVVDDSSKECIFSDGKFLFIHSGLFRCHTII